MGIAVNGRDIPDSAIDAEIAYHQQADNPLKQSVHELVLRAALLDKAASLGLQGEDEDERIEALFAQEVKVPVVDEEACRRYYTAHLERFSSSPIVEARHILLQVTPTVPLDLLRETGLSILDALRENPERFDELARQYSNCPSGAVGGSLGQLKRGDTVPEFEALLFRLRPGELAGHLLETRFGLHIVQVLRRVEGVPVPFDQVRDHVAKVLEHTAWQRALHQFLHVVVGQSHVEGVTLDGAQSPLVQ